MTAIRSRKKKPPVGMEVTVTVSFPPDMPDADAARAFLAVMNAVSTVDGSVWLHAAGSRVPQCLSDAFEVYVDSRRPKLTVVK